MLQSLTVWLSTYWLERRIFQKSVKIFIASIYALKLLCLVERGDWKEGYFKKGYCVKIFNVYASKLSYLVEEVLNAHIVCTLHGLHQGDLEDIEGDDDELMVIDDGAVAVDDVVDDDADDDDDYGGADDDDDDLHLLLDVPQLLFILLCFELIGRLDVLKVGDPDLKKRNRKTRS